MVKTDLLFLVDDDPIYVFTMRKTLEKIAGHLTVLVFRDGKAVYEDLKERLETGTPLPFLILLDLNMPVWDGWDFLDEYRKLSAPASIRIFIVSSSNHPEDIKRAAALPELAGFMTKPLSERQLAELLPDTLQ